MIPFGLFLTTDSIRLPFSILVLFSLSLSDKTKRNSRLFFVIVVVVDYFNFFLSRFLGSPVAVTRE